MKLSLQPGKQEWVDRGIYARGVEKSPSNPNGIVYGISYSHRGRRYQRIVGPSIAIARKALDAVRGEIAQGKFRLESTKRIPRFSTFAEQYLEDYSKPNKRSWERDQWAIKKAVGFMGAKRLDEVTAWDVERYRASRQDGGVSVATANRDVALLKHMLSTAVRWGILASNVAEDVKLGKEQEHAFRVLTVDEERRLLAECADHLKPLVTFAVHTGLRRTELFSLEWRDVDLVRHLVTVRRSKGGKVRHVPISSVARDSVDALPHRQGIVFRYNGGAIKRVDRAFNAAIRRSGIPPLRFHDLRHTYITRKVLEGVPLSMVQRLAGHATILTTQRYEHITLDDLRRAVAKYQRPPKP